VKELYELKSGILARVSFYHSEEIVLILMPTRYEKIPFSR
jgi:hypothetical protein